jgi:hypothetical protein
VASDGADRVGAAKVASDGSDHTNASRVAADGSDHVGAGRLAALGRHGGVGSDSVATLYSSDEFNPGDSQ